MKRAYSYEHGEYIVLMRYIAGDDWLYCLENEYYNAPYPIVYHTDEPYDSYEWEEISDD